MLKFNKPNFEKKSVLPFKLFLFLLPIFIIGIFIDAKYKNAIDVILGFIIPEPPAPEIV